MIMMPSESTPKTVRFEHCGKMYIMKADEIEAAYQYQKRQYLIEDAKRHLNILVFGVSDVEIDSIEENAEDRENFQMIYGISFEAAASTKLLEAYVDRFNDFFDCNLDENSIWDNAINDVLNQLP